jgi:molybdopterin molybdotransferase
MISLSEARKIMLEHVSPLGKERVSLGDAFNRTLAAPIIARRAQPPFRASAMDGYAVRSADTPGVLRLVGEAGAGHAFAGMLGRGECVRIFTGAPLPEGADAIVIQEDARRDGETITAPPVDANRHARAVGVDFAEGETLLSAPARLNGAALALAAAAGRAALTVARRPKLAIMSGGDEIVAPDAEPSSAQIFESASYGVAGMAAQWGASIATAAPYRDDKAAIAAALDAHARQCDLTIIIGGASVGDHDHARGAVESIGGKLLFEKVALRPGKPTWFALREGKPILGLPGNPTSAFVCARLFLRPLIDRMLGLDPSLALATEAARLRRPLAANGARETYLRARSSRDETGQVWVEAATNQDSSLVTTFAASDVLVVRPPNAPAIGKGDLAQVLQI